MAGSSGLLVPPWEAAWPGTQTPQEPVQLEDDGEPVNVTSFVRFELQHNDIRDGVLDVEVQFP